MRETASELISSGLASNARSSAAAHKWFYVARADGNIASLFSERFADSNDGIAPADDQGVVALKTTIHIEPSEVLLGEIGACLTDEIEMIWIVVQ
jgi:hypothetical protein